MGNIDGKKPTASCKAGLRKGVYERYCSVLSNLANLKPCTEVMQRNVCVGELYPSGCAIYVICIVPLLYIISLGVG